ncbi:c-type cytochrome [Pusillimonas sp. TS35]|jgi:mono/diheme cytochrome c family protein|uniref:c-type cytochrome n=1 Tax=Paracandidimonas lactea TaxID=2895524 RepID=UPI00136814CA|nr:cytochrome c [Paracandidimonas lactea]MYN14621.1 c-type cytochrome [Pusillimonas sp. TS35]
MSDQSKQTQAQRREMPEPYEGGRPVPKLVLAIVAGLFAWAIGYLYLSYQPNPPSYGDRRTAADFKVAGPAEGGKVDGAQLYTAHCAACHQATGVGLAGVFPPLAKSEWVTGKPETTIQIVLHGISGALTVQGATYNGMMPMFKDKLSDAELAAVVSHIRTSFGNAAGAVDEALVKAQRAATASHDAPWNGDAELSAMK